MKNYVFIVISALLFVALGVQIFMLYRIHERLDPRFSWENSLAFLTPQSPNTWFENPDNWTPYEELLQMRNQMEQMFNNSVSRFQKNSVANAFIRMPAVNMKDEKDHLLLPLMFLALMSLLLK